MKYWPFRNNNGTLAGIQSCREFQWILQRERELADRYDREFSLLVFDVGGLDQELTSGLAKALRNRARSVDQIGWSNRKSISVLMPDTPSSGARKLAADVCEAIKSYVSPPKFAVFSYPSQWFHDSNRNSKQMRDTGTPKNSGSHSADDSSNLRTGFEPLATCRIPVWKRLLDIGGAVFGLILLFPLFLLIGIFIKIVSPGPAFYGQERVGHKGISFFCWKFRTMKIGSENTTHQKHLSELIRHDVPMAKLDQQGDPRIIPLGKFLRQSGLDELPQLFNVLRGEMSLVGPRPCCPYEACEYKPWHRKRFDSMPGITGLWQVSGKNTTTFNEMVRLDLTYVKRRSFLLDLLITLKTIPAILSEVRSGPFKAKEVEYVDVN
jgi:lipopolysaccharide/colanic/teichoic acid biosynthesis glycosyltransferase